MRNLFLHLLLPAGLLLYGYQSIAQRGNAAVNRIIQTNYWGNSTTTIDCPETGMILISFTMHVIEKVLPDGKESWHTNSIGEGFDEFGEIWRFHHLSRLKYKLENGIESDLLYLDQIILHGPNGKQLKMRTFVLERDGEIVILNSDPLCD